MVLWFHTITILTMVMTVNVIRYHNLDHDDDSDCDPEESFESKEGGLPVGRIQPAQCPLIANPISFIEQI